MANNLGLIFYLIFILKPCRLPTLHWSGIGLCKQQIVPFETAFQTGHIHIYIRVWQNITYFPIMNTPFFVVEISQMLISYCWPERTKQHFHVCIEWKHSFLLYPKCPLPKAVSLIGYRWLHLETLSVCHCFVVPQTWGWQELSQT